MTRPRYLRVARALALLAGAAPAAGCAERVGPGVGADGASAPHDASDAARETSAPGDTVAPSCDLDAASNQFFIRGTPPNVFAANCPPSMAAADGQPCSRCVYCNYDNPITGDCTCDPAVARWRCNYRMATMPPPDLPIDGRA